MQFRWLRFLLLMITSVSVGAPIMSATEYPQVGPDVFDWMADGEKQLQAALADAETSGRRVVLMLGANWCAWCHRLDAVLRSDPELKQRFERDFVLLRINVNWKTTPPRNAGILARYRRAPQRGIPVLTLLDAKGRVLANPDISQWETAEPKSYDVDKLRAFFAEWASAKSAD